MFRQYRVIFRQLVFITSTSYISVSIAAVGNKIWINEMFKTLKLSRYAPGKHDSNINTQTVYTATIQNS